MCLLRARAGVRVIITSRVDMRHWDDARQVRDWEIMRNRATHRLTAVSETSQRFAAGWKAFRARTLW